MASESLQVATDRITKENLAAAVANERGVEVDKVSIDSFELSKVAKFGENIATVVRRVDVKALVDGVNDELCYAVKCEETNELVAKALESVRGFECEVDFYHCICKELQRLRKEVDLAPLNIADSYYLSAKEGIIIMENLKVKGFDTNERSVQGLEPKLVEKVLIALGELHATSFHFLNKYQGGQDQLLKDHPWLKSKTVIHAFGGGEYIRKLAGLFLKDFGELVRTDRSRPDLADKMQLQLGCSYQKGVQSGLPKPNRFVTILHGDVHVSNILFKAEEFVLVDYQLMTIGSPGTELSYFLNTSTHPATRKAHLDSWLKTYHSSLEKTMVKFGYPATTYSLEDVRKDYRDALYYGFYMGFIYAITIPRQQVPEMRKLLSDSDRSVVVDASTKDQEFSLMMVKAAKTMPGFLQFVVDTVDLAVEDDIL